MKLRTNLFVSIKILEQLCAMTFQFANHQFNVKNKMRENDSHTEQRTLFGSTRFEFLIFVITSRVYHFGCIKNVSKYAHTKHTTTKLVFILWWNGTQIETVFDPFSIADKYE